MKKKVRSSRYGRDAPAARGVRLGGVAFAGASGWTALCADGYQPVAQCPEVQMCIGVYADLIASMTIRLMRNTEAGDVRVYNELSRRLDIDPNPVMTHQHFVGLIVRALMEHGNQVTVPVYAGGLLQSLVPLPPSEVSVMSAGAGVMDYSIAWRGVVYRPDEVLHFVLNPDPDEPWRGRGYTASLRDVVRSIRQANATRQALQESPAPSIIVKVDGLTEEFQSPEGRRKLRAEYLDSTDNGTPWFIPSEAFSVEQVKPLTIADLAIADGLTLDKRSVAAIFGVPPFLVGVGDYHQDEYQHFITARVLAVAREIEQVLTRGLLYSPDLYWSFNPRSLYNYAMMDLVNAGKELVDRAAMTRNEWRDWLGLPPGEHMDELYLLENYLPTDRLGDQKKLKDGGEDNGENEDDAADADA